MLNFCSCCFIVVEDVVGNKMRFRLNKEPARFLGGLAYAAIHAGKKDLVVKLQLVSFAFVLLVCQNMSVERCLFECPIVGALALVRYMIGLKTRANFSANQK